MSQDVCLIGLGGESMFKGIQSAYSVTFFLGDRREIPSKKCLRDIGTLPAILHNSAQAQYCSASPGPLCCCGEGVDMCAED